MGLKNCIYTSRIGVGRSNARNHPYLGYAVSASPREPPPGSLSRLTTRALVALAEPPEQRFIRAHPDIMDISIYIDDVVILDSTDLLNTHSDLQTLLLYYLMYHNISLPALIHAASG
ncbi:hypothetical protein ARMGADRAFT_1039484 [Armillaria gallica]|uniref:Uncharacterized protein n=1 Tax=Armillaria gallica TaxID=47427 RepID=A0A2H3CDQ9_ARMGA|nr:hypothetical protein ARMGADRAFT_1039484 [Armillaria gallica]